jgi:hypothetical protein
MSEDVKVIIKSVADTSGIDELGQKIKNLKPPLEDVPPASDKASNSMGKMRDTAQRTASAISQIGGSFRSTGPAAQAFQGAMQVAAQGIQAFMAGVGGLVTILATLAAVLGQQIANAFQAAREKVEAGKKANDEFGISVGKINEAKLTAIVAQYDAIRKAADDACAASERMQTAIRNLLSAQERVALAKLDEKEQGELAALDPNTEAPEDRARIGAKYTRLRASTSADFAGRIAASAQTDAQKKVETLQSKDQSYADQIAAMKKRIPEIKAERQKAYVASLSEGGEGKATSSLGPMNRNIWDLERQTKAAKAARIELADQLPVAKLELETAKQAPAAINATRAAAESSALVTDKASDASVGKRTAEAAALRAKEKQLADLQLARDAEQKKLSDAAQAEAGARGAHTAADTNLAGARTRASKLHQGKDAERRLLAPYEKADKDAEALERAASTNLAAVQAASTASLKNINDQLAALARELASQKNQKSTARMDSGVE